MERLNRSIDAAEVAVKDLRSGVAKGSGDLVRDLERTLRHARANAQRVGKAVTRNVERAVRAERARRRAPTRTSSSRRSEHSS